MAFLSPYGSKALGREEAGKVFSGHKGVWGQDLAPGDYGLCLRIKDMGKNFCGFSPGSVYSGLG